LHSEELRKLYPLPNIKKADKMKENELGGDVARMGEGRKFYRVLVGKPERKNHLKDQVVDGRMGSM
jgi:hypothetical protein